MFAWLKGLFGKPKRILTDYEKVVLTRWYDDYLAKYPGASVWTVELFGDELGAGTTFINYVEYHGTLPVYVTEDLMTEWLTNVKGHAVEYVNGRRYITGVRQVIWGSVKSGNYGT